MKHVILHQISLQDWQGLTLTHNFDEKETVIAQPHGYGKSRLVRSFYWVLTGLGPTGQEIPNIKSLAEGDPQDATASVTLSVDGVQVVLSRTYGPVYDHYGTTTGNRTIYTIDGVQVKQKEFNQWVEHNICSLADLPFYCNPLFAVGGVMDWREMRKWLVSRFGTTTLSSLCGEQPHLATVPGLLGNTASDKWISNRLTELTELGKTILRLDGSVQESQAALAAIPEFEHIDNHSAIARIRAELDANLQPRLVVSPRLGELSRSLEQAQNNLAAAESLKATPAVTITHCPECRQELPAPKTIRPGFSKPETKKLKAAVAAAEAAYNQQLKDSEKERRQYEIALQEYNAARVDMVQQVQQLTQEQQAYADNVKQREAAQQRVVEATGRLAAARAKHKAQSEELALVRYALQELTERMSAEINQHFEMGSWSTIRLQVNGSYAAICEFQLDGVPYPSLNPGSLIPAGMLATQVFQQADKLRLPVLIDAAESALERPEIVSQAVVFMAVPREGYAQ